MAALLLTGRYRFYTPILSGWVNSTCVGDQQLRALTLAFTVSFGQAVVIEFQQYQLPRGQAPKFSHTHRWASALCLVIALTLWTGFGIDLVSRVFGKGKETGRPRTNEADPKSSA